MAYDLNERLVIGIASSALFELTQSDAVFRSEGERAYRAYQEAHKDDVLGPGVAFSFIRRVLSLNDLDENDSLVEVIVLSRNDPDTGLRVMKSIESHGLPITRAVFMQGRAPYKFMPAFNMSLFLSANDTDVRQAVAAGLPAGTVMPSATVDDPNDLDLRIAFDFDGVLGDDSSEQVFVTDGLDGFREHETVNVMTPLGAGPLKDFLANINRIQDREEQRRLDNSGYERRLHVSIITARNAPAHARAVESLKSWGVRVNDAFFLGGVDKGAITAILQPHIYFDDQASHLSSTATNVASVHVPFGAINE